MQRIGALTRTQSKRVRNLGTLRPGVFRSTVGRHGTQVAAVKQSRRLLATAVGGSINVDPTTPQIFEDFQEMLPPCDDSKFIGMTGAEIFHELMVQHKVDTIFGYPGGAILPVFDAIHESPNFKFILPRHEQGAGHMAEGYARATGKPGIVLVTSGPGATNTVTPLMDAMMDGTPMIVFSGQVPTAAIGTDAFQEADTVGITRACTKWNVLVKDVKELPRRINEAFFIATSGRPGPVLVDLPKDVTAVKLTSMPDSTPRVAARMLQKERLFHKEKFVSMSDADCSRIGEMINNAKRPVLYAGQGVLQSRNNDGPAVLRALAESGNIPVTTTLQGMGAFDEANPLSLKMLGMHGSAAANFAMQKADLIVALGARFDDRVTGNLDLFAPEAKKAEKEGRGGIIHFEISPKNLHKVVQPTEAVLGDVVKNMNLVLPHVKHQARSEWFEQINGWKEKYPFVWQRASVAGAIKPQQVLEEIQRQTASYPENLIVTTGVGQHQMWAAQYLTWRHPRSFITSGGAGTMGFGVPAAIGAKVACPEKVVIDVDGDASFSMTGMEMLTAAEFNIGVKILILNNNFQGMVKQWQDLFYEERYSGTPMHNPDFALLADAMGCKGMKLSKEDDIERVVAEFLAHDGPVVLDAICEKDEHVYPMVPAGKGLDEMVFPPSQTD